MLLCGPWMINTIAGILVSGLMTTNPAGANANIESLVAGKHHYEHAGKPAPQKDNSILYVMNYFLKEDEITCPSRISRAEKLKPTPDALKTNYSAFWNGGRYSRMQNK